MGQQLTLSPQPRRPQEHRPHPHNHQRPPETPTPHLLQGQEVHASGPPRKADSRHPPPVDKGRAEPRDREAEEEAVALPRAEVCRQGRMKDDGLERGLGFSARVDNKALCYYGFTKWEFAWASTFAAKSWYG